MREKPGTQSLSLDDCDRQSTFIKHGNIIESITEACHAAGKPLYNLCLAFGGFTAGERLYL